MRNQNKSHLEFKGHDKNEYRVTLPCGADQFTEFISSLLGKGQAIEKDLFFLFLIDRHSLQTLNHLIKQRLSQNESQFINFSAKIYYNDNSSVEINNADDFFSFREIKNIISDKLLIEWIYLVQFPVGGPPEKQTISILFDIKQRDHFPFIFFDGPRSKINIKINHSNRTFGNDILNLLEDDLENYKYVETKMLKLYRNIASSLSVISAIFLFCTGTLGIFFAKQYVFSGDLTKAEAMSQMAPSISTVSDKVQFLIENLFSPVWVGYYISSVIYVLLLTIVSFIFGITVNTVFIEKPQSYLLLTDASVELRKQNNPFSMGQIIKVLGQIFLGIFIGVIANIIFTSIWLS